MLIVLSNSEWPVPDYLGALFSSLLPTDSEPAHDGLERRIQWRLGAAQKTEITEEGNPWPRE